MSSLTDTERLDQFSYYLNSLINKTGAHRINSFPFFFLPPISFLFAASVCTLAQLLQLLLSRENF